MTDNEQLLAEVARAAAAFPNATDAVTALAKAESEAAEKVKKYSSAITNAGAATASAAKQFAGAMAGGAGSIKDFGVFVDLTAKGINGLISTVEGMALLNRTMGNKSKIASVAIAEFTKGLTEAGAEALKFMLTEVDALSKTFSEFGQIGALGSKGMLGLVEDFRTSGLMMTSYKKIVAENTTTFANFKGSVKDGIGEFVKLSQELTESDGPGAQLRMLGFTLEQIGEAGAAYVSLQVKLGRNQSLSTAELTRNTIEYAKSMDEVAKLTGINKKTLEKNQEEMISKNRFSAALENEKDETVRDAMQKTVLESLMFGDYYQQGISDLIAAKGAALTEAAKATQMVFSGIGPVLAKLGRGASPEDVISAMQEGEKISRPGRTSYEQFKGSSSSNFYGPENTFNAAKIAGNRELANKSMDRIRTDREAAYNDAMTKNIVTSTQAIEEMYKSIQNQVIDKLPAAATAIQTFAAAANAAVTFMLRSLPSNYVPLDSTTTTNPSGTTTTTNPSGTVIGTPGGAATAVIRTPSRSTAPAPAPAAPASAPGPTSAAPPSNPIEQAILNLKGPESTAGGDAVPQLLALAQKIQNDYPGARFTALNDTYHQKNYPNSLHTKGRALDFTLPKAPTAAEGAAIVASLKSMGFNYAEDNYTKRDGTGPHFHAQLSAMDGGVLSGPRSGYSVTMHDTEAVVPLPDGRSIPVSNLDGSGSMEIQAAQLSALAELVSTMKNQVSISSKILQYAA